MHLGAFINDVMQVGGRGGQYICDNIYKVRSKITILVRQRGEGVRKSPNLCDVIYERPLRVRKNCKLKN